MLQRPEARNALDRQLIEQLSQGLDDLLQEKRVRAVILTGAGADFCAGLDLKQLHSLVQRDPREALPLWHEDWLRLKELLEKMLRYPKPIIAAVDGAALGGGMGLVLASDLVVMSNRAQLGVPAVRHGLIGGAVAPLLAFRTGGATAARLLLTAQPMDAAEAHRLGLCGPPVAPEQIWAAACELVERCAGAPYESLQATKRLLNETIGEVLETQMSVGAAMGATSCTTDSAAEGLTAFVEKRSPRWP